MRGDEKVRIIQQVAALYLVEEWNSLHLYSIQYTRTTYTTVYNSTVYCIPSLLQDTKYPTAYVIKSKRCKKVN